MKNFFASRYFMIGAVIVVVVGLGYLLWNNRGSIPGGRVETPAVSVIPVSLETARTMAKDEVNSISLYIDSTSTDEFAIPPEVFEYTSLLELNLSGRHLKTLPPEISRLKNLRVLHLANNELTDLPAEFSKLENLQTLSLGSNKLTKIPEIITSLKNLTRLDLSGNPLKREEQEKIIDMLPPGVVSVDMNTNSYQLLSTSTRKIFDEYVKRGEPIPTSTEFWNGQTADNESVLKPKLKAPSESKTFEVYGGQEIWPKILEAKVTPPDVHVGDTQYLSIVVQDSEPVESVYATTQLDHSQKIIKLSLVGEVSENDLIPRRFAVNDAGKLALAEDEKNLPGFFKKAQATDDFKKYRYEAQWKVEDTHDATYATTLTVRDTAGRKNSITIAWSDACNIPLSGDWNLGSYGNCTIASTDGVDNGNVTIQSYTLSITGGSFVYNPGRSITLSSGGIAISAGAQIKQTNLWVTDADADGYPAAATQYAQDGACASCRRRYEVATLSVDCNDGNASIVVGSTFWADSDGDGYGNSGAPTSACSQPAGYASNYGDCYDSDANVKPGQTGFFGTAYAGSNWDYDCNGSVVKQFSINGALAYCYKPNYNACYYPSILMPGVTNFSPGWFETYGYSPTTCYGCFATAGGNNVDKACGQSAPYFSGAYACVLNGSSCGVSSLSAPNTTQGCH